MAVQFIVSNPPARSGSRRRSSVAKSRRHRHRRRRVSRIRARGRRAVGRRGRAILGVSMPMVESGVATAGGMFIVNAVTAQVQKQLASSPWANSWYARAGVKLLVAIILRMLVGKISVRWANAVLGGGIASICLTVAKQFAPGDTYSTTWGLAGLAGESNEDLAGYFTSQDVYTGALGPGGLNGMYDQSNNYAAFGS